MEICQECGAQLPEGETCQSLFEQLLALEFSDPNYGAVHFLTVACFMIQHGRYSDEAAAWARDNLRAYLDEGKSIEQIRAEAGEVAPPGERKFKFTRQPSEPPAPKVDWSMTIPDVALEFSGPESYQKLVKKWARVTLKEMRKE